MTTPYTVRQNLVISRRGVPFALAVTLTSFATSVASPRSARISFITPSPRKCTNVSSTVRAVVRCNTSGDSILTRRAQLTLPLTSILAITYDNVSSSDVLDATRSVWKTLATSSSRICRTAFCERSDEFMCSCRTNVRDVRDVPPHLSPFVFSRHD